MKRSLMRKSTLTGMTMVIAASMMASVPAGAATPQSPWEAVSPEATSIQEAVFAYFENLPYYSPYSPRVIKGTMMIPGNAMLTAFGYQVKWNAAERKMTATHAEKPGLTFWAGRAEAEVGGKKVADLATAPFIEQQTLWIPLRLSAEAAGMSVTWNAANRTALVRDPLALPLISVSTRSEASLAVPSLKLEEYMKENFKVNLRLNLIPPEYYREKVNVMIAAGDMSSLMLILDPYQYQDNLLQSIARDLTGDIEAYPRLKQLVQSHPGGRTIDGKLYGIPRPGDLYNAPFPAIRQDWLDALNLNQPQTMDELYEVLKLFTDHDPDGNDKKDTLGMTGYMGGTGLGSLAWVEQAYTGNPERFSVRDGKVIDHAVSPEEEAALSWLRRAYSDGLIDKEFPLMSQDQALARVSEKHTGLAAMTLAQAASLTTDKEVWVPLTGLKATSASAPIVPWNTQGNGMYIVSAMAKVDPQLLLGWLDKGMELTEAGKFAELQDWDAADQSVVRSLFGQTDALEGTAGLSNLSDSQRELYTTAAKTWKETSYADQTLPEANVVWNISKYIELNAELEQYKIKIITGAASLEDWKQHTAKLVSSATYKEMIAELNGIVSKRGK